MKNFIIIPLIIVLFVSFGCNTERKGPTHLSVGKDRLINSGLAFEAVKLLKKAEQEEANKVEPRALLVIAYSHGLATGDARQQGVEAEFKNQKAKRIRELTEAEMRKMLEILKTPSRVQKNGLQALVEKGPDAAVLLVDSLAKGRYPKIHTHLYEMLGDIGAKSIEPILKQAADVTTPLTVRIKLIRVIGDIGDKKAVEPLKVLHKEDMDAALKMQINTTLYRLGEVNYKTVILKGVGSEDVAVRRAAAKAMVNLSNVPTKTLVTGLQDSDSDVVTDIAVALKRHKSKEAVNPLVDILTSDHSEATKSVVLNTLTVYADEGITKGLGLASRISRMLIDQKVSDANDRLRLVKFLKHPAMLKQLKIAKLNDDLGYELYQYARTVESNDFVKTALNELLDRVEK